MKLKIIQALLAFLLIFSLSWSVSTVSASESGYTWNIPTGYTPKFVATGTDGTIYLVTLDNTGSKGKLFAISDGNTRWEIEGISGEEMYVYADKEQIYLQNANHITVYDFTGKIRWQKDIEANSNIFPSNSGLLVYRQFHVSGYDKNGKFLFDKLLPVGMSNTYMDPTGNGWFNIESFDEKTSIDVYSGDKKLFTAVSNAGEACNDYITSNDGELFLCAQKGNVGVTAYNKNGEKVWNYLTHEKYDMVDQLHALPNGNIAFTSSMGKVLNIISKDGKIVHSVSGVPRSVMYVAGDLISYSGNVFDASGKKIPSLSFPTKEAYLLAVDGSIVLTGSKTIQKIVKTKDDIEDNFAADVIYKLKDAGIISGYPDGTFRPNESVTKEEYLKLLLSALKVPTSSVAKYSFSDVDTTRWSSGYLNSAITLNIITSEEGNKFHPGDPITREQMAVYTSRALRLSSSIKDITFKDASSITFHPELVAAAVSKSLIAGYEDGSFKPLKNLSRAEAAVMIERVINYKL